MDHKQIVVDFDQYFKYIDILIDRLSNVDFDCVVAVLRGGYIPGEIISRKFNKPLCLIRVSSYHNGQQHELSHSNVIGDLTPYQHVLVVDDLIDSGKTLEFMKHMIPNCSTAVIFNKNVPRNIQPDVYAIRVENQWIIQPMEKYGE